MTACNVLVIGAGGFIGSRVVAALLARGHAVTCAGRDPAALRNRFPSCRPVGLDLARPNPGDWASLLPGMDAVVNAAGALRGDLAALHSEGPIALWDACAAANVRRVIQISALGADQQATAFLATKEAADRHLLQLRLRSGRETWHVIRPSLVIGRGGGSTALFSALAALPWPIRLGPGTWRIQPIHVTDLALAVADLAEGAPSPGQLDLVGPEAMSTDQLTSLLRRWMGLRTRPFLPLPLTLLRAGAALGDVLPSSSLTSDSLSMLASGNTGPPAPLEAALGWRPRALVEAMQSEPSVASDRLQARLLPIRAVLLACLAAVWIGSGIASLLLPPARANALLAAFGLRGAGAMGVTWAGAVLDLLLGAALLRARLRSAVLLAQLATMALYTVLATVALPDLWLDPFGSLLKNLAVLGATLALLAMED